MASAAMGVVPIRYAAFVGSVSPARTMTFATIAKKQAIRLATLFKLYQ